MDLYTILDHCNFSKEWHFKATMKIQRRISKNSVMHWIWYKEIKSKNRLHGSLHVSLRVLAALDPYRIQELISLELAWYMGAFPLISSLYLEFFWRRQHLSRGRKWTNQHQICWESHCNPRYVSLNNSQYNTNYGNRYNVRSHRNQCHLLSFQKEWWSSSGMTSVAFKIRATTTASVIYLEKGQWLLQEQN